MSQISRPFQIALVVLVLFIAVWFVALRGHSSGSESTGASASATQGSQTAAPPPAAKSPAESGTVYKGSAPGVGGLTRAIARARGAVTQSQQNAQQLQEKSNQASSAAATQAAATSAAASARGEAHANAASEHAAAAANSAAAAKATAAARGSAAAKTAAAASKQATVEAELQQGKVVLILFWNPQSVVDAKVRSELNSLGHQLGGKVAVHDARANQVGSFGSFTRTVQVYGTPTILIVNKQGQTTSLTGLTDVFSLKQAITEAQSA
jgi:hypothetical protein